MSLKYLIRKEVLQFFRNPFLPKLMLVFPVVIMCVMPWVMNMEIKNVVVDVVDNDHSVSSQRLTHRIEQSRYFIFNGVRSSYDEALQEVENSSVDCIVVIPQHYEKDLTNGKSPQVLIAANAVNGTKGSLGSSYLAQIVTQSGGTSYVRNSDVMSVLYLYNKNLNYKLFMIPALMAILVMLLGGFLPALNIVGEKEAGTIEAINVTPVSKWEFILAKLIPYWILAMIIMTICFLLAWLVYGLWPVGNILLIYLLALLLALCFSGLGIVVSNYNETMQQAMFVMWFIVVCMMLLSGLFTPTRSMPHWAQLTTIINPVHYFIDAIRTIFVRGGDFQSISSQVLSLAIMSLILDGWAVVSYRKNS
jgi:ABC-2 type transport system permease protein